ncbi:MAG: glycosyl hydrolase family 18 protein [Saprospiraceae bacterium]
MNYRFYLVFTSFLILSNILKADNFRIIGYLPTYRFSTIEELEVEKLTHLNLAFAQATYDGKIALKGDYPYVIRRSKEKNPDLKVILSLAGGGLNGAQFAYWKKYMLLSNRSAFINQIVTFLKINNLDGVDVDLEWNNITSDYPGFVAELSDSIRINNFEISAAFPAMKRYNVLTNADFDNFDYINVMAYDNAGPWQPNVIRQHSSFDLAEKSIEFWVNTCNIPRSRINLGIPFYGYDFAKKPVRGKTFASIISADPELAFADNTKKTYYNSIPTIIEKTQLAKQQCGGVMLWEIGQDAIGEDGDYSLLHYVHNTAMTGGVGTFFPKIKKFTVIQSDESQLAIHIENNLVPGAYFVLKDIVGCANEQIHFDEFTDVINFDLAVYPRGVYILSLVEPGLRPTTQKIMKLKG